MNKPCKWFILGVSVAVLAQQRPSTPHSESNVMLAAVSRDDSLLAGGIGSGKWKARGTVAVEALAYLTESGDWQGLPCGVDEPKTCLTFEREYLSKPHSYAVVSADGEGAVVRAAPVKLSECYNYTGTGTYAGAPIARSAIAASSDKFFAHSEPPKAFGDQAAEATLAMLRPLVPGKLDSTRFLRLFSLRIEGQQLVIVQRAFSDIPRENQQEHNKFVFAIGSMSKGELRILQWKENTDDEDERLLGTIALKSGREFLITVVSDPEGQWFRVYGIRNGRLEQVYSGGGSSC